MSDDVRWIILEWLHNYAGVLILLTLISVIWSLWSIWDIQNILDEHLGNGLKRRSYPRLEPNTTVYHYTEFKQRYTLIGAYVFQVHPDGTLGEPTSRFGIIADISRCRDGYFPNTLEEELFDGQEFLPVQRDPSLNAQRGVEDHGNSEIN